jgi:hypothetical protein
VYLVRVARERVVVTTSDDDGATFSAPRRSRQAGGFGAWSVAAGPQRLYIAWSRRGIWLAPFLDDMRLGAAVRVGPSRGRAPYLAASGRTLLVGYTTYSVRSPCYGTRISVMVKRSTDGGRSFTPILDWWTGNLGAGHGSGGTLAGLALDARSAVAVVDGVVTEGHTIWPRVSPDGGTTWSDVEDLGVASDSSDREPRGVAASPSTVSILFQDRASTSDSSPGLYFASRVTESSVRARRVVRMDPCPDPSPGRLPQGNVVGTAWRGS